MGLRDLFRFNIEWQGDNTSNTIVYKFPLKNDGRELNNKSTLTVRESQIAIFVHKGKIADIFNPGLYELKTDIIPILTKLASWKYAFETPITLDVYFVNTKQFTNLKWGTANPILISDPSFGPVRIRSFGSYAFAIDKDNADKFLQELFGTSSSFRTDDIQEYLRSMLVSYITDAVAESKLSVMDMAANTVEFNNAIKENVQNKFKEIGLKLTNLIIENVSLPPEVEKYIDERSRYGILGDKTDVMMKVAAAESMKEAAKNPGSAGMFMGAGVGMGAGMGLGTAFADAFKTQEQTPKQIQNEPNNGNSQPQNTKTCPSCNAQISSTAKFCPECGEKMAANKFCPECGAQVSSGAKFCPECGTKLF